MINNIRVINFKSHKETNLELGWLTVLSGQNGVGKSSLIQSFLLLRQTNQKNRLHKILDLNEPLCRIGKTKDAIYFLPNEKFENEIHFILADQKKEYCFSFDASEENDYLNRIGVLADSDGFEDLNLFQNSFQYISAARNTDYRNRDYEVKELNQISFELGKGELAAQFLSEYGKKIKVLESLKNKNENDDFLLNQVSAWEREISTGVNINVVDNGGVYDIKYNFETGSDLGPTDNFLKENVGFGLSYALPIIVAILSASKDAFIIIENPEAHIHPYGISKLTELICLAAQSGIQIIVETHSDHIINGILVQSKNLENQEIAKGINKDNVKIYYFQRDEKTHSTEVIPLPILNGGKIQRPPKGFFDQIDNDMNSLMGIKYD
jgi:predicted ATPase